MARPRCCRRISGGPAATVFKPAGIPTRLLEEIVLELDEFEAVRLADFDGLYQDQAARRMNVSRPTFGRIVESARRKLAEALIHGKALRIEGGPVRLEHETSYRCRACECEWRGAEEDARACPRCRAHGILEEKGAQRDPCRKRRGMGTREPS